MCPYLFYLSWLVVLHWHSVVSYAYMLVIMQISINKYYCFLFYSNFHTVLLFLILSCIVHTLILNVFILTAYLSNEPLTSSILLISFCCTMLLFYKKGRICFCKPQYLFWNVHAESILYLNHLSLYACYFYTDFIFFLWED